MSHMNEKHLGKENNELIYRLLTEWKANIGCFYYDMTNILSKGECIKIESSGNEIVKIYKYKNPIGYGFNRKIERLETYYAKVIMNLNKELITAYPELTLGYISDKYIELKNESLADVAKKRGDVYKHFYSKSWKLFLDLKKGFDLEMRFISNKKNLQIRIYFKNYIIKINEHNDIKVLHNNNMYLEDNTEDIYNYIFNFINKKAVKN